MLPAPSLGDLTFEVDPRREWTPPHLDAPAIKLWDSPRTSAAYTSNGHPYRAISHTKPATRPSTDIRVPDISRPGSQSLSTPVAVTPPVGHEPSRLLAVSPRRASPVRVVVCPEPSLSQLPSGPMAELPTVRGQPVSQASPASINASSAGFSGRRGMMTSSGPMVSEPTSGVALADHMSHMSSQQNTPDPVDTYLQRYQVHQRIRDGFRSRQDEHLRTVTELGAKIQAMTRAGSPTPGSREGDQEEAREGEEEQPARPASASSAEHSAAPPPAATSPAAAAAGPATAPPLPDHPLGRNRFAPLPAALSPNYGGRRPSSASDASTSPGGALGAQLRSGLTEAGEEGPTPGSPGPPGSVPQPHPNQGAYLALPDGSFAGSAPFRGAPTQEGVLFERYNRRTQAADLPELQLRYLRPGTVAVREPRQLKKVPRQPAPPSRALPNGIPASRLERLSARRRDRSPPRLYQQHLALHLQQHRPELLLLTGATVATSGPRGSSPGTSGTGLGAVGDGLLRSVSLLGPATATTATTTTAASAASRGRAASAAPTAEGGTLAQYLAVSTAPASGEPLLDDNFYEVLQQHFRSSRHHQTDTLRAQLNVNLPLVLRALNCVNVTERPASAGGKPQSR